MPIKDDYGGAGFSQFQIELLYQLERIADSLHYMSNKEQYEDIERQARAEGSARMSEMVQRLKELFELPGGMMFADIAHYINTTVKPLMERGKEWNRQASKPGIVRQIHKKKRSGKK